MTTLRERDSTTNSVVKWIAIVIAAVGLIGSGVKQTMAFADELTQTKTRVEEHERRIRDLERTNSERYEQIEQKQDDLLRAIQELKTRGR